MMRVPERSRQHTDTWHCLRVRSVVCVICLATSVWTPTYAAEDRDSTRNVAVYVGVFHATVDSTLAINSEVLPPISPIEVEDTLGVDKNKWALWGGVRWKIAPRHSLEAEFFELNRSNSTTRPFEPPLQLGDTFIESGTISTRYETKVYRLTYGYSVLKTGRSDVRLRAGLHAVGLRAGIALSGTICTPSTSPVTPPGCPSSGDSLEGQDVGVPLPHFGFSYSYDVSDSVALGAAAMGFALEVGEVDGSILEADADLVWRPLSHFGVGAGFRYFRTKARSGSSDLNGSFELEYYGPAVYVIVRF